ncbi:hypothetical protein H920_17413 [Fukomys damarensis]|uniref:Uncharacterized protein n=1 Tax=Fukomys damarensis TaxID=885580 RepID=A0A091CUC6_FUKDA|nr:hypothetical protein H920_17413 [Fukomys damarensis]
MGNRPGWSGSVREQGLRGFISKVTPSGCPHSPHWACHGALDVNSVPLSPAKALTASGLGSSRNRGRRPRGGAAARHTLAKGTPEILASPFHSSVLRFKTAFPSQTIVDRLLDEDRSAEEQDWISKGDRRGRRYRLDEVRGNE